MAGGIVGWHFFDVESGLVPEESTPSILPNGGRGRIVVLAATPFTFSSGWAARAAISLAKDWSGEGLRIFLMDLGMELPSLHEALGLPNGEGVSDAFLYGASVQHIANPVLDESFFFAPAGTATGDPEEVLGHPRWNDLAGGFSEADATLLLFLPTDIPGAGKILSRSTDIVFLSAQGESADRHLGPAAIKVVSMMGPFGSPPEEIPEAVEATPPAHAEPSAPEVPVQKAPDDFGAGLDLAEGFGTSEHEGEMEAAPSFDFSGGLEWAEGFGEAETEGTGGSDLTESPAKAGGDTEEIPDFSGELGLLDEGPSEGFGDDLVMGAGISGEMESDGPSGADAGAPDFGADFADMGPMDGSAEDEGFGGELVQGPDFGGSGPGEAGRDVATESSDRTPPSDTADAGAARERPKPPHKRRPPPKKKFPLGLVATVIILLGVLGALAGTALGYVNVPGLGFLHDYFGEIPEPPLTLSGPQPTDELLRFSLLLFTYREGEIQDAVDMQDALRTRLPGLLFLISAREVDRAPVYQLMAGPALDRIEAEELRGPLAEVLTREDPNAWTVRETPRAFYLGERSTLEEAQDYMGSLSLEGIHSYILHVTYSDGAEGYEILSGAFEGVQDARPLQLRLRGSGFEDVPLIERRGRLPE